MVFCYTHRSMCNPTIIRGITQKLMGAEAETHIRQSSENPTEEAKEEL